MINENFPNQEHLLEDVSVSQRCNRMHNILIIEPSSSGLRLLNTTKSMGLKCFVASANTDERIIPNEYLHYIDHLEVIDTYNIDNLNHWISDLITNYPLSAIIPGSEYHVPVASHLSNLFNLPGINPQYVEGLRNKSEMRSYLENAGVRCPKYRVVSNTDELLEASEYVGFPCVVKPVASAGSIHVSRVDSLDTLKKAYLNLST